MTSKEVDVETANASRLQRAADVLDRVMDKHDSTYISSGHLPLRVKLIYASADFAKNSVSVLMSVHVITWFNNWGMNLNFISFFIAIARSFDVVTDPWVAWLSDQLRGKHGRRRPFMAVFSPFYAACIIALLSAGWVYSESEDPGRDAVLWFGFFYMSFYIFDTLCNVPHNALGPELTDDPNERNSVFFWTGVFAIFGLMFAASAPVGFGRFFKSTEASFPCDKDRGIKMFARSDNSTDDWENWRLGPTAARGMGLMMTGVVYGVVYVVAVWACILTISERKASVAVRSPPLIASLMAMCRNGPFMSIVPAWIMDQVGLSFVTSMVVYYMTYVVQPGKALECDCRCTMDDEGKKWLEANTPDGWLSLLHSCREDLCDVDFWLGIALFSLIIGALVSTPIWLWLCKKFDKREVWLVYNLVSATTNIMFILVRPGNPINCVICVFFNGLPFGAQFLTDSILADIIDYDEFLTGVRSEARFTVGKSLLPKIVAIPAQTIPLTLLVWLGFNQPKISPGGGGSRTQEQNDVVQAFISVVFFVLPFGTALCSYWIKKKFPIKNQSIRDLVREGNSLHMEGRAGVDPLTGRMMHPLSLNETEEEEQWRLDHFFLHQQQQLKEGGHLAADQLLQRMKMLVLYNTLVLIICLILVIVGFNLGWIEGREWAWLVTLSALVAGIDFSFLITNIARLRMALKLKETPVDPAVLNKLLDHYAGRSFPLGEVSLAHMQKEEQSRGCCNKAKFKKVFPATGPSKYEEGGRARRVSINVTAISESHGAGLSEVNQKEAWTAKSVANSS